MYRTIVIGHDGTAAADAELRFAEQRPAAHARLVITRVVPDSRRAEAEAELERVRAASAPAVETRVVEAHSTVRGHRG
jgi:hypothetical protein